MNSNLRENSFSEALTVIEKRFRLDLLGSNQGFHMYKYTGIRVMEDQWKVALQNVVSYRVNVETMYITLDELDENSVFVQPCIVDEDHEFHEYMRRRTSRECSLFGYLSFVDWLFFFSENTKLIGIRIIKYIYTKYGIPFIEFRNRNYEYDMLKGSYVVPTQIEACLQACQLEWDILLCDNFNDSVIFKTSIRDFSIFTHFTQITEITENKIFTFSLRELIKDYLKAILPWPKKINNKVRSAIPWAVKNTGFFGEIFQTIHVSDEIPDEKRKVHILNGTLRNLNNPNRIFADSKSVFDEYYDMLKAVDGTGSLKRFLSICLFIDFEPMNTQHTRFLRLLLALPIMGGYGRADKYLSTPQSVDNTSEITSDIGIRMHNNIKRIHAEAVENGFYPILPSEQIRSSLGLMKSTGAGATIKIPVMQSRLRGEQIVVSKKATVGLVKGMDTYTKDMSLKYNDVSTAISTGSRDVPVKATRTIYPISLSALVAQDVVTNHLSRYANTNIGTYKTDSPFLAAQISAGTAEAAGSRLIDDIDMMYMSGSDKSLIITSDYSSYDSRCTYKNFRKPIIDALKELFSDDHGDFFGRSRSELVDCAFGDGRVHNTLWNIGRRVVRASSTKYDLAKESDVWKKNKQYTTDNKINIIMPPGVKPCFCPINDVHDPKGDILVASAIGEDYARLTSHASGELTTLLFNSIQNLSISDELAEDSFLKGKFKTVIRRVVGDDKLEVVNLLGEWNGKVYDKVKSRMTEIVATCGHEQNPSKTFMGFGFVEYRQSHCLRGAYIPKSQIMIISSEKVKEILDVKSFMASLHNTMLSLIARGMSVAFAEKVFWYIVLMISKFSFKRYTFSSLTECSDSYFSFIESKSDKYKVNNTNTNVTKKNDMGSGSSINSRSSSSSNAKKNYLRFSKMTSEQKDTALRTKYFFIPKLYWYVLPASMNGGGIHPYSFLLKSCESDLAMIYSMYENSDDFCAVIKSINKFKWYKIEPECEYVEAVFKNIDRSFMNSLILENTRDIRKLAESHKVEPWWDNISRQLVERAVLMEPRILGKNFAATEEITMNMIITINRDMKHLHDISTNNLTGYSTVIESILKNSGFIHGCELSVDLEDYKDLITKKDNGLVIIDSFLDVQPYVLRMKFGYGSIDFSNYSKLNKLTSIISRDAVMRNVITAESLVSKMSMLGVNTNDPSEMAIVLTGIGFDITVANRLVNVLKEIKDLGGIVIIKDNGALSDEFTVSLGTKSRLYSKKITFLKEFCSEELNTLRITIFTREILSILYTGRGFNSVQVGLKKYEPGALNLSLFVSRTRNVPKGQKQSIRSILAVARTLL